MPEGWPSTFTRAHPLRWLVLAALVWSGATQAQTLAPGTHAVEGGWGSLVIQPATAKGQAFDLQALGGNAHSCQLDGVVVNRVATLEGADDKPCRVRFVPKGNALHVQDGSQGACSLYCGMRASFEGVYEPLPKACETPAVSQARKQFKRAYDAKQFGQARTTLQNLWDACGRWMHWSEAGRIRNDLAITHHHLGDPAACRAVLQPLAADAAKTDAQIREDWPPSDADGFLPIARATRHNLKLCSAP